MKRPRTKLQLVSSIVDMLYMKDGDIREHVLRRLCADEMHYEELYDDIIAIKTMLMSHTMKELKLDYQIAIAVFEYGIS